MYKIKIKEENSKVNISAVLDVRIFNFDIGFIV